MKFEKMFEMYASLIKSGDITIDDVPEKDRESVLAIINSQNSD